MKNNGTETIASFSVYYYFTTENGKTPVLDDWNTPNSSLTLENLGGGEYRVKFEYSNVNLSPNQEITYQGNSFGLHYSDRSNWDKSNDYSNNLSNNFSENNKIVVYEQGQQNPLYGNLPNTNDAPVANNVSVLGIAELGITLIGSYDYQDDDDDQEGQSIYKWYHSDDENGLNETPIQGANSIEYVLQNDDLQKYIKFEVTPIATSGESPGQTIQSVYTTQVVESMYRYPKAAGFGDNVKVDGKIVVKEIQNEQEVYLEIISEFGGSSSTAAELKNYWKAIGQV